MSAHPGEILLTEFPELMGIGAYRLAALPRGFYEVLRKERAISADWASILE